jgi:hypothetical protein
MWYFGTACLTAALILATAFQVGAGQQSDTTDKQGQTAPSKQAQPASATAPAVPVEDIIKKFAAKEAEFREARNNFTYTQSYLVQEYTPGGRPGGEYRMNSDIIFTPDGKRTEKITYSPQPTLEMLALSQDDLRDLQGIQPFVLTTEDLPKYTLEYAGREHVDEIGTYVFQVAPKTMEKGQRYFQGTIWVDDQDLQIVKTRGKAVPDSHKKGQENLFPTFETYREQIDGKYWFPTYTRADDTLHFSTGDVRMRMVVRYTNYKQFKTTIKLIPVDPPKKEPPKKP